MGDSICKWRAARPRNIVELVNMLPHYPMQEADFRNYMEGQMPGFFHTPYQLACQLALYFISEDGIYYPRFSKDINESEAEAYLKHLVTKYYVPNPYTPRGFKNINTPIILERTLVEYLESVGGSSDFELALRNIIKEEAGNLSATKTLLSYSDLLVFQGNIVSLQPNYKELMEISVDRKDKTSFFQVFNQQLKSRKVDGPLQLIYFGAPGTGKSHRIKQVCREFEHYRITFHPDTDYASFVGSYKPITHSEQVYTNMGDKAIPLKDSVTGEPVTTTKITYQYVYQAFLNAYIAAWKQQQNENPQPVFLVIEEINRGNCAQIFGDIFQLLDRNESGFSDYPIIADNDLRKELAKEFATLDIVKSDYINGIYGDDLVAKVKSGSHLLLPNNFYIWATMNTSDQSLFPIDSAFKRRWEWKYVKIADSGKNYRIAVNGNEYDWWQFVDAINSHIGTDTDQEDKKLGYFFVKATKNDNGKYIISADTFLSKVIFFIYNDVYKDFGFDDDIFKDENGEEMTFANYFNQYGDTVPEKVERFIQNLDLKPIETIEDFDIEENSADETEKKSNMTPIEGIEIGNSIDIHANGKNAINFFVDFLKLVGLQRVSEFTELKRGTFPVVVCSETNPNERYYRKSEEVDGVNYFIHTHNGNDEKRKFINMIADKFYPGETIVITPNETID